MDRVGSATLQDRHRGADILGPDATKERDQPGADDGAPRQPPIDPRQVTADPRKFYEYVLDPENADGKDHIFIQRLGYRYRNIDDAVQLSTASLTQAKERLAEHADRLGARDKFGQRVTIEIALGDLVLLSGWILRPDNVPALATPFAGFAPRSRRV
jgi:hypothetical protein